MYKVFFALVVLVAGLRDAAAGKSFTQRGFVEGRTYLYPQDAPNDETQVVLDGLAREELRAALWTAVDKLSPQQRAAVVLQVQEELSTPEIAAVMKCSEATVRVHLHRALQALRKTMRKD